MFTEQDKTLIKDLNLGHLPEERQTAALGQFYNTLKMKVGMALEDKLSDEQLAAFGKVSSAGDDQATVNWLRRAVPDYEQVVAAETATLKQEIERSAATFRKIIND